MLRPAAKASSRPAPKVTEPVAALAVRLTSRAGVQKGHTATEKGMPSRKAPHGPLIRLPRSNRPNHTVLPEVTFPP